MAAKKQQWVWAKWSASVAHPSGVGVQRVTKGDTWPADDPVVKANRDMFADEPTDLQTSHRGNPRVEQATAAPGETR